MATRVKGGTRSVGLRLQSNLVRYAEVTLADGQDRSARLRELLAAGVRAEVAADPARRAALVALSREQEPEQTDT